jgi:hypothetical protein
MYTPGDPLPRREDLIEGDELLRHPREYRSRACQEARPKLLSLQPDAPKREGGGEDADQPDDPGRDEER